MQLSAELAVTLLPYCFELWHGHLFPCSNYSPRLLNETSDYTQDWCLLAEASSAVYNL